jgi:hypothetical protein
MSLIALVLIVQLVCMLIANRYAKRRKLIRSLRRQVGSLQRAGGTYDAFLVASMIDAKLWEHGLKPEAVNLASIEHLYRLADWSEKEYGALISRRST